MKYKIESKLALIDYYIREYVNGNDRIKFIGRKTTIYKTDCFVKYDVYIECSIIEKLKLRHEVNKILHKVYNKRCGKSYKIFKGS